MNVRYLRDDSLRGFNRYTICLLRELQKRDDLGLVLFTDDRSPIHPSFQRTLSAPVVSVSGSKVMFWEQVRLPLALWQQRVDVFHAPTDNGIPWLGGTSSVLTYHSATAPGVQHMIDTGLLSGQRSDFVDAGAGAAGRLRHDVTRWLYLSRASRIVTVSDFAKRELVELLRVPPEKLHVIYEAPDETFREQVTPARRAAVVAGYDIRTPYLLFVGGFDKIKNVSGLLRAYSALRREPIPETLVVVGSGGDVDGARALASSLGLVEGRDVTFLTRVHGDLPALYQGATLFVTLSWRESFCFPVVEAMASGLPVVASRFGAIPEILGDAGILVNPGDCHEIVGAVRTLLGRSDLRRDLGERARQRSQMFSWQKAADETMAVYRDAALA